MIPWTYITRFGDVTIMSLIAFAIAAWLLTEGEKRLAWWWSVLFWGGMSVVAVTKMAFIGWGIGITAIDFTGFSGHATRAVALIPVLFYLMLQKAPSVLRASGVLFGFACATIISLSRLALHAHSVSEVLTGMLLGATIGLVFIRIAGSSLRRETFKPLRIALAMLLLLPAHYVQPAPTQKWLTQVTLFFSGQEKPFIRGDCKSAYPGTAGTAS